MANWLTKPVNALVGWLSGYQPFRGGQYVEQLKSNIPIPAFLPFFDTTQNLGETQLMRMAYRRMLADPIIKSAFLPKIFGVGSLDLQLHPASESQKDQKIADQCHWNLTRRLRGGIPQFAYNLLVHGGMDGVSICEKVWGVQEGGLYDGKEVLREVKPKDVDNDLVVHIDEFKNIDAILGLRYNAGLRFDPRDFLIYLNLPLFGWPPNSDFRAAYANWWRLDTIWKLRMMGAEKRALPIVSGEYQEVTQQKGLQAALGRIKWSNWLAVPKDTKIQVLDMAGQSDQIFKDFRRDVVEEIFQSLNFAYLDAMAGQQGQHRGNSKVGESRSELAVWYMMVALQNLLNDEETGLIKEIVDRNYVGVSEYPEATLSGVDDEDLAHSAQVDKTLQEMGFDQDQQSIERRYARKRNRNEPPMKSIAEKQMELAAMVNTEPEKKEKPKKMSEDVDAAAIHNILNPEVKEGDPGKWVAHFYNLAG